MLLAVLACVLTAVAGTEVQSGATIIQAVAVMQSNNDSFGVTGKIVFTQSSDGGPVNISAYITGLTDGLHGFHVHALGNFTQICNSTGAHYNPQNVTHGGPDDQVRHVGDLGNVKSYQGIVNYTFSDKIIQLFGNSSILGRTILVHADEDDLGKGGQPDSNTTGHAGARRACGIIGFDS